MTASRPRPWCILALVLAAFVVPAPAAAQVAQSRLSELVAGALAKALEAPVEVEEPAAFLARQLEFPRVQGAYERKAQRVEAVLEAGGVGDLGEVFFRVFKKERELEVWAREPAGPSFRLVKTYPVCEMSGRLGPKRRQGDLQVPEGFYAIDTFNPWSRFHLSMRVDYPNAVDRVRGSGAPLGGDIYIHGGCATIGCVPVTDEYIEELYLVAAAARDAGQQRIPVHIFPTRLDDDGLRWLADTYGADHVDYPFWQNLQQGYLAFERTGILPWVEQADGRYTFDAPPVTSSARTVSRTPASEASSADPGPLGVPVAGSGR